MNPAKIVFLIIRDFFCGDEGYGKITRFHVDIPVTLQLIRKEGWEEMVRVYWDYRRSDTSWTWTVVG